MKWKVLESTLWLYFYYYSSIKESLLESNSKIMWLRRDSIFLLMPVLRSSKFFIFTLSPERFHTMGMIYIFRRRKRISSVLPHIYGLFSKYSSKFSKNKKLSFIQILIHVTVPMSYCLCMTAYLIKLRIETIANCHSFSLK